MIQSKRTYNNGFFEVQEIYSDKGMKILDQSTGALYDNSIDEPITVPTSRINDCLETTEPVEERKVDSEENPTTEEDL